MADEVSDKGYAGYLQERALLTDAARESARTFDKAVLAFGSAVFGASIAFLKVIAPAPVPDTLVWLGVSWGMFSLGLLAILLSFLFSHQACLASIRIAEEAMVVDHQTEQKNRWSIATGVCNYVCVVLLFIGMICWSVFALENLNQRDDLQMNKDQTPTEKRGYVPPAPPARRLQTPTGSSAPPPSPQNKNSAPNPAPQPAPKE